MLITIRYHKLFQKVIKPPLVHQSTHLMKSAHNLIHIYYYNIIRTLYIVCKLFSYKYIMLTNAFFNIHYL